MKLTVRRLRNNGDATIGMLLIDDAFECFTLEDEPRTKKVWGETRIPAGTYEIKFRTEGGFHDRYLKRFPDIHHGILHLQDVPGFEYVLIHIGNTDDDTAGCLLVGSKIYEGWKLSGSTNAYKKMYPKVAEKLLSGERVTITYLDEREDV